MKHTILLLIYIFISVQGFAGDKISRIKFCHVQKTDTTFLKNRLTIKPGQPLTPDKIDENITILQNLQLFSEVRAKVDTSASGIEVQFELKEIYSLLPIFNFGGIRENYWFQLGAFDSNWLGRSILAGGYYRYYERHSFEFFLKAPFLFRDNWGINLLLNQFATIEPAYFETVTAEYNVDRATYLLLIRYNFNRNFYVETGSGLLEEKYSLKNRLEYNALPTSVEFEKYIYKSNINYNDINYYYHYLDGSENETMFEIVTTRGYPEAFWQFLNVFKWYSHTGDKTNLAFRLRSGISKNEKSPFVPYVLDSYITVRGSGNRVARGTAELTLNAEYRYSVFETGSFAMQSVLFTDWSAWRAPGSDLSSLADTKNSVSFAGAGLRLYLQKFNNFIFRIDYGHSLTKSNQHGIVFGTGQYF